MKFLLLLFLSVLSHAGEPAGYALSGSGIAEFAGEQLRFSLHSRGVTAAEAHMVCSLVAPDRLRISANIETSFLINLFFPIHNSYDTCLDRDSGRVLQVSNVIRQKNISHHLTVRYDRNLEQAVASNGEQWSAPAESLTIFAMLYQLRRLPAAAGDTVSCLLDAESQLCHISGVWSDGNAVDGPFSELPVRDVLLRFEPQRGDIRTWKTDLLTNRIGRPRMQMLVRLGPRPESLPLFIQVGEGKGSVIMKLRSWKRS